MNRQLEDALRGVQLPARGLWRDLYPMLQRGDPYGTLQIHIEELADEINISEARVRQAMGELRNAGIIKKVDEDVYICPLMRDERRNYELRNEIRTVFAHWHSVNLR